MLAYNRTWLDHLRIHQAAEKWFRKSLISEQQLQVIKEKYVSDYKHTNFFVKIGLFLFTFILTNSAIGLMILFIGESSAEPGIIFIISSAIIWFVLELFVKNKNYFSNGIDDMLLYAALAYFISGLAIIVFEVFKTVDINNILLLCLICLPVLVIAAIRFTDALVSLIAYCCLLSIIFILVYKTGATGKTLMPFAIMLVSFIVYQIMIRLKKINAMHYWHKCLSTVETSALITLYAAGNYFVVRESSALLFNLSLQPGQDIPLAVVFYVLTLAIPIVYIITGIKNKDRIPLRTGIILSALSILTYRYYYHFMSAEMAMIIAGLALVIFSWLIIKKLSTPWRGITFKESDEERTFADAESLLITQSFGQQAARANDFDFGGGKFGGGGAGGEY